MVKTVAPPFTMSRFSVVFSPVGVVPVERIGGEGCTSILKIGTGEDEAMMVSVINAPEGRKEIAVPLFEPTAETLKAFADMVEDYESTMVVSESGKVGMYSLENWRGDGEGEGEWWK